MTIPRRARLALVGLALTASLTACGSSPSAPAAPPASVAPRPRPTLGTSWLDQQDRERDARWREDARRAADQADQADRERKLRDDFDRKLRDSEERSRCEAEKAASRSLGRCL